jgi:hypothetical protein
VLCPTPYEGNAGAHCYPRSQKQEIFYIKEKQREARRACGVGRSVGCAMFATPLTKIISSHKKGLKGLKVIRQIIPSNNSNKN